MDADIQNALEEHSQKLDKILTSVEKTRKYFMWTLILSIVFVVLPLVGLVFVIPQFLNTITSGLY